jgi:hypothetical protein
MPIILIRHGRVHHSDDLPLTDAGKQFSSWLVTSLGARNIRTILSSSDKHCLDTIAPLAARVGTTVRSYDDLREVREVVRQGDWTASDLVIVYRMMYVGIFDELGITRPGSSEAYGTIWIYRPEDGTSETIATGQ